MSDLRTATQQALEALKMMRDEYEEYACPACDHADAAIYTLRAALAEPPMNRDVCEHFTPAGLRCDRCGKATKQDDIHTCTPRRLTDAEIGEVWFAAKIPGLTETQARLLIRAAERRLAERRLAGEA